MNDEEPVIRRIPGKLPPLWDRQVVFVANLLGLFFGNREEMGELRRQVGTIESYGGRLVPLLGLLFQGKRPNLAVLERLPDANIVAYFEDDLGLTIPEIAVLKHEDYPALSPNAERGHPAVDAFMERARALNLEWLDAFVTDESLELLARGLGCRPVSSARASKTGNNKLLLHRHLVSAGLPVFHTEIAEEVADLEMCLEGLRKFGYLHAAVRAPIGASGIGIARIETSGDGAAVPPYLFYEGPCLVQGWLDVSFAGVTGVHSPSVQLFLDDTTLNLFDITEQILDANSVHEGNIAPPPWLEGRADARDELLRQAEIAGRWLHKQGYRGTASVDLHVVERNGAAEVRVCEINARVTGATYPSILARHFMPGGAWLMRNLRFAQPVSSQAVLAALDRARLLFRPGANEGLLPINFNSDASDDVVKGQFLCLASDSACAVELLEKTCGLLPVRGEYDRD